MIPRYDSGNVRFLESGNQTMQTVRVAAPTDDLGRALMNAGEVGVRLAGAYAQVNDARQLFEAERDMQGTVMEFAKWQQENPDESKWLGEWEKRTSKIKELNDKRALTADGRLALERSATGFLRNQTFSIQQSAVKQAAFRARKAGENSMEAAKANGDEQGYNAAVDVMARSNVIFPEEADGLKQEGARWFQTAKIEKEFTDLRMMARDNPAMARELAAEGVKHRGLTEAMRFQIEEEADITERRNRAEAITEYRRRIGIGEFPAEMKDDPRLTDLDRAELSQGALEKPSNDGELFQRALTKIESYTPTANDELERAKFEVFLENNFSGPYLATLKQRWQAKSEGGEAIVRTTEVFQQIDEAAFGAQLLGEYKKPKLGPDGKQLYRKEKGLFFKTPSMLAWAGAPDTEKQMPDQEIPVFEEDPAQKAKILGIVGRIKETLQREVDAGKLRSSTEVQARASELMQIPLTTRSASRAANAALSILPAKPADTMPIDLNSLRSKHAQNPGK